MKTLPSILKACSICKNQTYSASLRNPRLCTIHNFPVNKLDSCDKFDSVDIPMTHIIRAQEVIRSIVHLRITNNTISDETIDFMKHSSIDAIINEVGI